MSEDLSAFPLVDPEIVAELQEDMADQFPNLVTLLIHEIGVQLGNIQAAIAQGDAGELYRIAHRLKSGAASMGAAQLSELARRLENRGHDADLMDILPLLEQSRLAAEQTQQAFHTLLKA
ncbi:MAG: Hpt domain-containing protein [Candidatus Competibacteraceae bacterium]